MSNSENPNTVMGLWNDSDDMEHYFLTERGVSDALTPRETAINL